MGIGFVRGMASPCNFFHPSKKVSTTVHGDDFSSTGREADLIWFKRELEKQCDIKTEFLGPSPGNHLQEIRILNRVLCWTASGLTYEADPRHAEILIKELNPWASKAVATPGSRDDTRKASTVTIDGDGTLRNTSK